MTNDPTLDLGVDFRSKWEKEIDERKKLTKEEKRKMAKDEIDMVDTDELEKP